MGRRLLTAAFGLVLALALVAAVERGLRAAHLGEPPSGTRLVYQRVHVPALIEGARPDGTPAWRTVDPRHPWQAVLRQKPANSLRVFVFGGSAIAGLGYGPNVTVPRYLERLLLAAGTGKEVEVVNLGTVAIASRQERILLADACARYAPDLVVVCSGNNEFLELHSEKYARLHMSAAGRLRSALTSTHLYGLIASLGARPQAVTTGDVAANDQRLTQREIVKEIDLAPGEISAVHDEYERNLRAMVASAGEHGVPILLSTCPVNWRWRGREDLPADWWSEWVLADAGPDATAWRVVLTAVDARLAAAPEKERYEWHHKRALALEALGDTAGARDAFRASMNADPHLRRAGDELAERVRRVAAETGTPLLDAIDALARRAPDGIVGFGEFYDYVHFTPRGALLVAVELYAKLRELGFVPEGLDFDPEAFARDELARLEALSEDPLEVGLWLGVGGDLGRVHERDLWKHQAALAELDARLAADPGDVRALAWRGNARFFQQGQFDEAVSDYEAALAVRDDAAIRANLVKLRTTRRP